MNKKVPLWAVLLILWFSVLAIISYGWMVWHIDQTRAKSKAANSVIFLASLPYLIKESIKEFSNPRVLVRPDMYPDINGLKAENGFIDSNYILLPTFDKKADQSVIKLIRLADQKIMHQWSPDFGAIQKQLDGKRNIYNLLTEHPLLATDGSIIFTTTPLLIKINKEGKQVWSINKSFHHSIEYDADGNTWSPSVIKPSKFLPGILPDYRDDAITEISPDGKVLFQKSVAEILVQNGYRALLLGTGLYEEDLTHLNDIQPALSSTQYWIKGDLLISLKHKSTVFLYRPATNKIIWLQTGPWLNQHDVDFIDDTHIGIFGNNIVRIHSDEKLIDGYNEEYIFDFKTKTITTPYTAFLKKAKVATRSEGRSDILANGDLFIEETDNCRLLRGSTQNINWQFVSRIDNHSVSALEWTRFIPKEQFKTLVFLKSN